MQRFILITVIFLNTLAVSFAQEKHSLTIDFTGMESAKGTIFVALYNTEKSFLKKGFKGDIIKISDKKAQAVFKDIPEGTYAVSAFHDENDNKKMDTNFFGIPKEAYGTSNDAKGFMGPPKFKDAKFEITSDKNIIIKIH